MRIRFINGPHKGEYYEVDTLTPIKMYITSQQEAQTVIYFPAGKKALDDGRHIYLYSTKKEIKTVQFFK